MKVKYSVETAVEIEVADRVWLHWNLTKQPEAERQLFWAEANMWFGPLGRAARWPRNRLRCGSAADSEAEVPGTFWAARLVSFQCFLFKDRTGSMCLCPQIQSQPSVGWLQAVKAVTALPVKWKVCIMHMVSVTSVLFIKSILVLYRNVLGRPGTTYTLNCDPEVWHIFQKVWCHLQLHRALKYFTVGARYNSHVYENNSCHHLEALVLYWDAN